MSARAPDVATEYDESGVDAATADVSRTTVTVTQDGDRVTIVRAWSVESAAGVELRSGRTTRRGVVARTEGDDVAVVRLDDGREVRFDLRARRFVGW